MDANLVVQEDCSDVGEICWWKKVCWWRIFCMLVKLYVGEDRNLYVCWRSMLAKSFLYVGEKNCMLVKNLNRKLNVCWWSMLVKNFLYVGEHFEQKFKCMLVKYVGETFSVCWWKVCSWKHFRFHQHTGFSPTYIFHQHASPTLERPIISWLDSKIYGPEK